MLNMSDLRGILEPLSKFGQEEITFDIPHGASVATVSLRPLLPKEEIAAMRYATSILEDSGEPQDALTKASGLEYMDSFRAEVIAYSIAQFNKVDLRVPFILREDGVKIEKHVAVRELITSGWSRGMLTIAFSKYGDLVTKIAEKADKVVSENVQDLEAEEKRLEGRLTAIREERGRRASGDSSVVADHIKTLLNAGDQMGREIEDAIAEVDSMTDEEVEGDNLDLSDMRAPQPQPEPVVRKSVIPARVPPPTAGPAQPEFRSSFEEEDHPDSQALMNDFQMAEALERARKESLTQVEGSRTKLAREVEAPRGPDGAILRGPDGEPLRAYQLASETLSERGRNEPVKMELNPNRGSVNPRFRKPGN